MKIKITEEQLNEFEDSKNGYWDEDDDSKPYGSEIYADGKKNYDEDADEKTTTDVYADDITKQWFRWGWRGYGQTNPGLRLGEGTIPNGTDTNGNGVSDFNDKRSKGIEILANNTKNDDLQKIPVGVQNKIQLLLSQTSSLSGKQQAMVLYKLINSMNLDIPDAWKRELILMIKTSGNNKTFNM